MKSNNKTLTDEKINRQIKKCQSRKEVEAKHEKYMYETELIDFDKVMVFSYPAPYNKDKVLHLCEKTENGKIKFYGKDVEIPTSLLYDNKENLITMNDYDLVEGGSLSFSSNSVVDIVNCDKCKSYLSEKDINFLKENFKDKNLPLIRRNELNDLDKKFVALQMKELGKVSGQSTFENFEK